MTKSDDTSAIRAVGICAVTTATFKFLCEADSEQAQFQGKALLIVVLTSIKWLYYHV